MGETGVNFQPRQRGLDAKDVLAHIHKGPGGGAGQPAVFRFAKGCGVTACHHLAVDVRLGAVDLTDVLDVGRAGLFVNLKRPVAVADDGLGTADPGVVVAEDACVLLVARGVAGNFAQLQMIFGISRLQQNNTVLGVQPGLYALQRGHGLAGVHADARHDTHALGLDEDLAFLALLPADHMAVGIVGAAEPFAVPPGGEGGMFHAGNFFTHSGGFIGMAGGFKNLGKLVAVFNIHTCDKNALGHRAFAGAGGLETLARRVAEAVQVQAVVPVGAANQRQAVGAFVGRQVAKAAAQVFQQRLGEGVVVVEVHLLVQDAHVAGLAQVGVDGGDQPQRVIVEAGANVHVALFGQWLVLVVGAAVGELCGGDVQNTLAGAGGDEVHKAQQVLATVPETHAAAGAALVVAGGTAHVEGDHALVLVPDIHHTVELFVAAPDRVGGQQVVPVGVQLGQGFIHLRVGGIAGHQLMGAGLVDDAGGGPLFLLRVLDVAQHVDQAAALAGV